MKAPIVILTYRRLEHFRQCVKFLQAAQGASESDLFVVSDGPKANDHEPDIMKIREFASQIRGFKSLNLIFRDKNLGPAESMLSAERTILADYGRVISMEDDNLVAPAFLNFMNAALDFYECDEKVFSITGYRLPFVLPGGYSKDYWFCPWHIAWTYGTWKDKYLQFDLGRNEFGDIAHNREMVSRMKSLGLFLYDAVWLDWQNIRRTNDARLGVYMFIRGMVSVSPRHFLAKNIGFDGTGLNAKATKYFDVELCSEDISDFSFDRYTHLDADVTRKCVRFMDKNVVHRILKKVGLRRLYYRLKQSKVFN
jgi:hypothetical protein